MTGEANVTDSTYRNSLLGVSRYQPMQLQEYFGYDNLYAGAIQVEIALLQVFIDLGVIPANDAKHLDSTAINRLRAIKTSEIDERERTTKHDIRALVQVMQERLDPSLARWVHVLLTSYDVLDTGRIYQYRQAYIMALAPSIRQLGVALANKAEEFAEVPQIGRTHGQHALPITVGFWLATILHRLVFNYEQLEHHSRLLVGKISGAVGAYNAQVGLGIPDLIARSDRPTFTFEERVLAELGLQPSDISTQILPPDPLAYFLFAVCETSGTLAQLGRDCRQLMRTEIGEVVQPKKRGEVGSSTMAHKNNPTLFENLEGRYVSSIAEMNKVLMVQVSEHQRDLVNSSVLREFPALLVNLQHQLNTLLKEDDGKTFVERIMIDTEALHRNLAMQGSMILAEPLYIALQMAGYMGDAHELVNDDLVPAAARNGTTLLAELHQRRANDTALGDAISRIPQTVLDYFHNPTAYTGNATYKALDVVDRARVMFAL